MNVSQGNNLCWLVLFILLLERVNGQRAIVSLGKRIQNQFGRKHQENKNFISGEKIHEPDRQWYELTAKIVILLALGHYSYKKLICNAHSFHPKNGEFMG